MRVWDIDTKHISSKRLQGEHLEIHTMFSVILNNKKGYSLHPETIRWKGKLPALKIRHSLVVSELEKRGKFQHKSLLPDVDGRAIQDSLILDIPDQIELLKSKGAWDERN